MKKNTKCQANFESLESRRLYSTATADFEGSSSTYDWIPGQAANGWAGGWTTTTLGTGTETASVLSAGPMNSSTHYMATDFAGTQTSGMSGSIYRDYTGSGGTNGNTAHQIQFDYLYATPTTNTFTSSTDVVGIFGNTAGKYLMSSSDTWEVYAQGNNTGLTPTWQFGNGPGVTDTTMPARQGDIYHFDLQVFPGNQNYLGQITDVTTGANYQPSSRFSFRNAAGSGYIPSSVINFTNRVSNVGEHLKTHVDQVAIGIVDTAPSSLTATPINTGEIDLSWPVGSGTDIASYELDRATDKNFTQNLTVLDSGSASLTRSFHDTGVNQSTEYYYRIATVNSTTVNSGSSTSVNEHSPWTTVAAITTPLLNPTGLTQSATTPTTASAVNLTWTRPATTAATSYTITRALNSSFTSGVTAFTNISGEVNHFQDRTVSASTSYYYKIQSVNAATVTSSTGSTSVLITTPATAGAAPAAPTGLTVTKVSSTELDLAWASTATQFAVQRSYNDTDWTTLTSSVTGTTYQDTAVSTSDSSNNHYGLYFYRVMAVASGVPSLPSNPAFGSVGTIDTITVSAASSYPSGEVAYINDQLSNHTSSGDTVVFSGGTFSLGNSSEIILQQNRNYISFDGSTLSGYDSADSNNPTCIATFNTTADTLAGSDSNVAVCGLNVDGGEIVINTGASTKNSQILIDGNSFSNIQDAGIYFSVGLQNSQISNNLFTGTKTGGMYDYSTGGFAIKGFSSNTLTIRNNSFIGVVAGVHVDSSKANSPAGSALTVVQNYFSALSQCGLELQGNVAGVSVVDNQFVNPHLSSTFSDNDYSLGFSLPLNGSTNVDIERNYIYEPTRPDGVGERFGFELGGIGTIVADNYVYGINAPASDTDGTTPSSVTVEGNYFDHNRAPAGQDVYADTAHFFYNPDGITLATLTWDITRGVLGQWSEL